MKRRLAAMLAITIITLSMARTFAFANQDYCAKEPVITVAAVAMSGSDDDEEPTDRPWIR